MKSKMDFWNCNMTSYGTPNGFHTQDTTLFRGLPLQQKIQSLFTADAVSMGSMASKGYSIDKEEITCLLKIYKDYSTAKEALSMRLRICWLYSLQRGWSFIPLKIGDDSKLNGEISLLEIREMWRTPSSSLLPGSL